MKLTSTALEDGACMPRDYCFCVPDLANHVTQGANRSPPLAWSAPPEGTQSLVVICRDPDVPARPDDVNQEGCVVPADRPRADFFHWVLVDLAPELREIAEGEFSDGVTARGKSGPQGPLETRQGINDYTGWFAEDAQMAGDYFGYDGPCPPWNDALLHHYIFTIYALDLPRCPVEERFTGADVLGAIEGHVLDKSTLTVTYTLNPLLEC
jgi:Raf kinase inhibitor-like YbhB/YbcL family protein